MLNRTKPVREDAYTLPDVSLAGSADLIFIKQNKVQDPVPEMSVHNTQTASITNNSCPHCVALTSSKFIMYERIYIICVVHLSTVVDAHSTGRAESLFNPALFSIYHYLVVI